MSFDFVKIDMKLIKDTELKHTHKAVYLSLCSFADIDNGKCWPSHTKIAKRAGCCESTVKNSLKILREKRYIQIEERYEGNEQKTNLYTVNFFTGGYKIPEGRLSGNYKQEPKNKKKKEEKDLTNIQLRIIEMFKEKLNYNLNTGQLNELENIKVNDNVEENLNIIARIILNAESKGDVTFPYRYVVDVLTDLKKNNRNTLEIVNDFLDGKTKDNKNKNNKNKNNKNKNKNTYDGDKKLSNKEFISLYKQYFDDESAIGYGLFNGFDNKYTKEKAVELFRLCKKYDIEDSSNISDICKRSVAWEMDKIEKHIQNRYINEHNNEVPNYKEIKHNKRYDIPEYYEVKKQEQDNPLKEYLPVEKNDKEKQQDGSPAVFDW